MDSSKRILKNVSSNFLQFCSFALRENTSHGEREPSDKEYQAIQQIVERIEGISMINEAVTKICGVATRLSRPQVATPQILVTASLIMDIPSILSTIC
jgi:hypothetical protein